MWAHSLRSLPLTENEFLNKFFIEVEQRNKSKSMAWMFGQVKGELPQKTCYFLSSNTSTL